MSDGIGFYDPYDQFPYDREDRREFITEGVQFHGVSTEYVTGALERGDVVIVELMLKGDPTKRLTVTGQRGDFVETRDDNGNEFNLWARSESRSNPLIFGETWLREPDHTSAGIVTGITVESLG